MEHMEITHPDGTKGKITHAEAKRIAEAIWSDDKEAAAEKYWQSPQRTSRNEKYCKNAAENIRRMAGWEHAPETEDDLKEILFEKIPGLKEKDANLLYEVVEMAIALHSKEMME